MKILLVSILCINIGTLIRAQDNPDLGFISIDCGASEAYTDDHLLIHYETDEGFINSGRNMHVASEYSNRTDPQLTDLRSFPDGERNCYTLRPKQGNSNRYLIRASFFYGNYDGRSKAPEFDLYMDVNYWATIRSNYTYKEIIYTTSRDYVDVCLVSTGLGVPYISTLELRTLDNSTYNTTSRALEAVGRFDIGSLNIYRYPQDIYDCIWVGRIFRWTNFTNTTNVDSLKSNNNAYKVPTEVLLTAQQSENSSYGLGLSWISSDSSYSWYVFLHFAEIQVLQPGQVRQLQVYVNDNIVVANGTPEYLKPVTVATPPFDGDNVNFSVRSRSNLSAFFNAVELLRAIDLPNSPTDLSNVNAIYDIMSTYGVFGDVWQGDPCIPREFTWKRLTCSQNDSPKITSLNMSSSGLKGAIAPSFSSLTALESLDLSFNELNGSLPEFIALLPNLRVLDLSNNNLSGTVPNDLTKKNLTDKSFILRLDGNPNLHLMGTASAPSQSDNGGGKKKHTILPVTTAVASAILVLVLI